MVKSSFKVTDWLGHPVNARDRRHYSLNRNILTWEKQVGLEIFSHVEYGEHEKVVNWDLTGKGAASSDCGKTKVRGCDRIHDHVTRLAFRRLYKHNCRQKRCPVCFEGWAAAEAERALIRLASYVVGARSVQGLISDLKRGYAVKPKRLFHEALVKELELLISRVSKDRSRPLRPIHVVLSPPQGVCWDRAEVYRYQRRLAYQIAKSRGLYGSSAIPHPYRLRCRECKSTIPDYSKRCLECGCDVFEWFFSPHFHCVGFGWIQGAAEGYRKDGWVVKNLGIRKSVFWTFQYLLSHAGVSQFHVVTWFGRLAYNKMRGVAVLGSVLELCPECRAALRPMKWCLVDRPPPRLEYDKEDPYGNDSFVDPSEWRCF
jgi:hypothetical protein